MKNYLFIFFRRFSRLLDNSNNHICWKNAINTAYARNFIDKSVYEYMLENNKEY